MKKLVNITILCLLFLLFTNKTYALSVSNNNITIDRGGNEKVELYANSDTEITRVEFTLVYSTYDVPANFFVNSGFSDATPNGIRHNISFGEGKSGKILLGSISIHSAKGYTANGDVVNMDNQNINVTIGTPQNNQEEVKEEPKKEEVKEIDNNLIDKIESKLVKIELKKDVFEYTIEIDKDIEELDLNVIPKDENTKIEISSQKIEEIKDNKIIITASNGDIKQEYIINLKDKDEVKVTIDNSEFKESNSYKSKWIVVSIVFIVLLMIGFVLTKKK